MSQFDFVDDKILRGNLVLTWDHVVDLLTHSLSKTYKNKPALVSSFRKTIIIYMASIIEALLLWKLKKKLKDQKVELHEEWKYDVEVLCAHETLENVSGSRRLEKKSINRLDFLRILDQYKKHKLVSPGLLMDLEQVMDEI